MSWLYLQALVADFSEADCSDGEPSVPSKSTPTAKRSYSRGKRTAASILSRSGMTRELSTDARGVDLWMSSLLASRASHSALLENEQAPTTNETCGPTPSGSFAKWDPDTACWRTSQGCLFTNTLEPYSETWPRAGIACGGTVSRLRPLVPLIGETGSGLWPTPRAHERCQHNSRDNYVALSQAVRLWPTPSVCGNYNRKGASSTSGDGLATMVKMWPTPRTTDGTHGGRVTPRKSKEGGNLIEAVSKAMFPTPSARDWKSSNASAETMERNARPLNETVTHGKTGQLNPTWVEWLMGWPLEWTALKPLATDKFREWRSQHGRH